MGESHLFGVAGPITREGDLFWAYPPEKPELPNGLAENKRLFLKKAPTGVF
jgi:hypothetical protein